MKAPQRTLRCALVCAALVAASAVPAAAKETWTRVTSKNFVLVGNASDKEIRQVAARLEQFRDVYGRLYQGVRMNTYIPTTVVVFKSQDAYGKFAPPNTDGYFMPGEDVNYIALAADQRDEYSFRIIFHEYLHLLVNNNLPPQTPLWLNEGLAEFFSTFQVSDDRKINIGRAIEDHVLFLREQKMIPLQTLFAVDHSSPYYNESNKRGVFYAQSWALVHYLIVGNNGKRKPQLDQYLLALDKGLSAEESFRQVFGAEARAIEKELREYVGRNTYQYTVYTARERLEFDREMQSAPITEAESLAYLGDLMLHTGQFQRAEPLLQKAVSLDPNLALAYASLGNMRIRQNRFPEAKQYLEQAVKGNTRNYLAHYFYALALLRDQSGSSGVVQGFTPQAAETIRTHLRKAIELAPEFTEPYTELAFVNVVTGERLDESAELLKRAMALSPGKHRYAFMLAQVELRRKDYKAARRLLESLLSSTAAPAQVRAQAREVLGSVEQMEQYEAEMKAARERAAQESAGGSPQTPRLGRRGDDEPPPGAQAEAQTDPNAGVSLEQLASTLRKRREGEEQARALLLRVECTPRGIVFHVRAGERLLRLTSKNFEGVEIVTYTPDVSGNFTCGERKPANHVLVTYRPRPDARAKTDGEIVALDFIPQDWK